MTDTTKQHDDGGPWMPHYDDVEHKIVPGMSTLDYFAGQALAGMMVGSVGTIGNSKDVSAYAKGHCNHVIADRAYVIAANMIAEKRRREGADDAN